MVSSGSVIAPPPMHGFYAGRCVRACVRVSRVACRPPPRPRHTPLYPLALPVCRAGASSSCPPCCVRAVPTARARCRASCPRCSSSCTSRTRACR
jgi:hypothetical protein